MGYSGIQGIPMIASSPVRHDSPLNLHGLEVTSYQPPWKALSDFALHADLDNNGALNHTPAFQHLVNQASHHHFSYLYSFFRFFSSFSAFETFFHLFAVSLSCPHEFFSFRPCSLNIRFIIYLHVSPASSVWVFFVANIYSFNIHFFFFKSSELFRQIKRWPSLVFFSDLLRFDDILMLTIFSFCCLHRCTATIWGWVCRMVPRHRQLRSYQWNRILTIIIPTALILTWLTWKAMKACKGPLNTNLPCTRDYFTAVYVLNRPNLLFVLVAVRLCLSMFLRLF